jgi:putative hydrolase of the HAD superfamily
VDGVVLDPDRGGRGPWHGALHERFGVDGAALQAVFFGDEWASVVIGESAIEPVLTRTIETLGWDMTVDEILDCWFEADFHPNRDVVEAAADWAADGVAVVLVTNQEHRRAHYVDGRVRASLPIAGMAYSAALGFMKNDPAFYPAACDHLGLARSAPVVFLDDSAENVAVAVARGYGWAGVHYTGDARWRRQIDTALDA